MRLGPITRALACLLAAAALLAGCGSSDSTDTSGGEPRKPPAPPKSDFPAPEGRSLTEVLEAAGPSELVVSPAGDGLLQGREPLPLRRLRKGPQPGQRRRGRPLLRAGAEGQPGSRKRGRKGSRCAGPDQSPRRTGDRSLPGLGRKPRDPARLPRADDQRRPRRGDGRLLDRHRLPERRRVADRRRDQGRRQAERDPAPQRHRRRGASGCRGWGRRRR